MGTLGAGLTGPPRDDHGRASRPGLHRVLRGERSRVTRINIAYWALVSVLGALALFLVAAAARVLRWRVDDNPRSGAGG